MIGNSGELALEMLTASRGEFDGDGPAVGRFTGSSAYEARVLEAVEGSTVSRSSSSGVDPAGW